MLSLLQIDCVDCKEGTLSRLKKNEDGSIATVRCTNFVMKIKSDTKKYEGCSTIVGVKTAFLLWMLENDEDELY